MSDPGAGPGSGPGSSPGSGPGSGPKSKSGGSADWDADGARLFANLQAAYRRSRDQARAREAPGLALARGWHVAIMRGLDVPDPAFVGAFRGEAGLEGCEVTVGGAPGAPSAELARALAGFERALARAVAALDAILPPGAAPASADQLNAVIELCAWAHAEWVRIHPFANGNGRTARLWAGFLAMRYGLPPFVRLRPRPDGGYGAACAEAMRGRWAPTARVFRRMYLDLIAGARP